MHMKRKHSHSEPLFPERRQFDKVLKSLSTRFVTATVEELDGQIEKGLAEIADCYHVQRATVWELSEDGQEAHLTHFYTESGDDPPVQTLMQQTLPHILDKVRKRETFCVSRIDDLPGSAEIDKETLYSSGVKSLLTEPLYVGGSPRGALSLSFIRTEHEWSDTEVAQARQIGEVMAGALDRKRAYRALQHRINFETLISDISVSFVNIPSEAVDGEINQCLGRLSQFFGIDRCTLVVFTEDDATSLLTHSWAATEGNKLDLTLPVDKLWPWSAGQVKRGKPVRFSHLDELPEEAIIDKQTWKRLGAKSHLSIPLLFEGRVIGALSFGSLRAHRTWEDHLVERVCMVGSVLSSALARKRAEEALRASEERFREFFKNTPDYCYIISPEGNILNINHAALQALGYERKELIGKPVSMIYTAESLPKMKRLFADWRNGGMIRNEEMIIVTKAGNKRIVLLNVGVVREKNGEVIHSTSVQTDITARKKNEEDLRQAYAEIKRLKEHVDAENLYLHKEINKVLDLEDVIGRSDALKYVLYRVKQVAPTDTTILILGETGTGKGLIARAIHQASTRKDRPLIHVNCASLPVNLIESELFGREKGAFTDARQRQIGRFEIADGGTIFLDEIAELPIEVQAKLLRVIEDGQFERLGSPHSLKVDVRIMASTNRDLEAQISRGQFREDLFYRLTVFPITMPPLRKRPEDIPALVRHFVEKYNKKTGRAIATINTSTMKFLQGYAWPGNIRELENIIERSIITTPGEALQLAGPLKMRHPKGQTDLSDKALVGVERVHILKTLQDVGWKIEGFKGAAQVLGLKPSTLRSRMKKLGIRKAENRSHTSS
ncbi:MAG: sigma 54-interacting transcriptional regulator [Desulfobacteraceae bacterium]|nr:sigma 54-interacting transcriptional regulator [Desulfobacteraceae bacterium]